MEITKQTKSQIVVVPTGAIKAMSKKIHVDSKTIYSALHYKTNSWLAFQIRELAVTKYHGKIVQNQKSK